jgi:hypothetical protein
MLVLHPIGIQHNREGRHIGGMGTFWKEKNILGEQLFRSEEIMSSMVYSKWHLKIKDHSPKPNSVFSFKDSAWEVSVTWRPPNDIESKYSYRRRASRHFLQPEQYRNVTGIPVVLRNWIADDNTSQCRHNILHNSHQQLNPSGYITNS